MKYLPTRFWMKPRKDSLKAAIRINTVATKIFTVTDTQVVPTISIIKTNPSSEMSLVDVFNKEDYVKITVDGEKISIYVESSKVTYDVKEIKVPVTVNLSTVFINFTYIR